MLKPIKEYTVDDIQQMDYNQLIGLVKETNRPPGGENSIFRIAQRAFLTEKSKVLEIGTSTGFTAIELARLVGCQINAIDINPPSLKEAAERAATYNVSKLIKFEQQDATATTYADNYFDMVFCGNVTSLVSNREKALAEYVRILKQGGFVAAIPMYYIKTPSAKLLADVSEAIHVKITALYKDYWMDFFKKEPLYIYWQEDYRFLRIEDAVIADFVKTILARPHLKDLSKNVFEMLEKKYKEFMFLFRENLSHMGYTVMLLRKEPYRVDEELFVAEKI